LEKITLTLKSKEDLVNFRSNIRGLQLQLQQFQAITARKIANEVIVDRIAKKMEAANFSKKIIQNTIVDNIEIRGTKIVRIHIKSELFTESGFDVAIAREEGTQKHLIKPTVKQALRWISQGVVRFSKGHEVSGMAALKIIQTTLDESADSLQDFFNIEQREWIDKNLKGAEIAI